MASAQPTFPSPKSPDPAVVSSPPVASFASVVAGRCSRVAPRPRFSPLELPARQVGLKEGRPSISFSGAEIGACEKRFEHSIIAKFTAGRPRLAEIQKVFQSSWATSGRVSMSEVWDSRHVLLVFDSEEDVRVALASPINKVGHALFRLFRWHPDYNPKRESTITTIWVKLPGLPISIYDSAFIDAIVSTFGYFVSVDERTKACTALNFARACVELDVTKEIPDAVWVNMPDNKSYWQTIVVDSKIAFCSKCKVHGHCFEQCRKRRGKQAFVEEEENQSLHVDNPQGVREGYPGSSLGIGEKKEWKRVLSKKEVKAARNAPEISKTQERATEEKVTEDGKNQNMAPNVESNNPGFERAIVVYEGSRGSSQKSVSQANSKSRRVAFEKFIPNDLSGAELRLKNKPSNVLNYNEELGVYVHPEHLSHFMNIRDKAGSTRPRNIKDGMNGNEGDIAIEEETDLGSKHYSAPCPHD